MVPIQTWGWITSHIIGPLRFAIRVVADFRSRTWFSTGNLLMLLNFFRLHHCSPPKCIPYPKATKSPYATKVPELSHHWTWAKVATKCGHGHTPPASRWNTCSHMFSLKMLMFQNLPRALRPWWWWKNLDSICPKCEAHGLSCPVALIQESDQFPQPQWGARSSSQQF